ncbi:hypothetical protein C2W64_00431 [Brevibacillus laterosporus]|nr:hypothetical protein [Brevibacillus laterosporus]RAP28219.1 hypothetical protein C2W64_00431 [Brevibacillus laterosporus]
MNKKDVAACLSAFLLLLLMGCQAVEQNVQQAYSEPKQLESLSKTDLQNICAVEQDCVEVGNRLVQEINAIIPEFSSMEEYVEGDSAQSEAKEKSLSDEAKKQNEIEANVLMSYKINDKDELVEPQMQKLDSKKWGAFYTETGIKREEIEKMQKDTVLHQEVWTFYRALIPKEQRKQLKEFTIMTDGKQNILANVVQSENTAEHWKLEVDVLDASTDDPDLIKTLIHETAHLISLGEDQIPINEESQQEFKKECESLFLDEGCTSKDSYLNKFHKQFWPMYEEEWEQKKVETDEEEKLAFYDKYNQEFVSEYAITNVVEDWAETFTMFTLYDFSQNETTSESQQKFAKMKSLYAYSELVKARTEILFHLYKLLPELKR